jgi:hypothetical protein
MKDKDIVTDLLIDLNTLRPDLDKFKGNPAPALAERLILIINKMTPHASLFDDNFKTKIKEYILTYQATQKGDVKGSNIFKLIKPTSDLINSTLEKKLKELNG